MANTIPTALHQLLMEEGRVSLPGIGTLMVTPQAALISQIESRALPPADKVSFNANLVLDDGKLVNYLVDHEGESREGAERLVLSFIRQSQETLDAGRSLNLEGIGRLYKHHSGQITFSGSGDNFGKENFGLPAIDIQHIVRSERRAPSAARDPIGGMAAQARAKTKSDKRKSYLYDPQISRFLWMAAIAVAVIVFGWLIYNVVQNLATHVSDDPIAADRSVPRDRLNVPPPVMPKAEVRSEDAGVVNPDRPPRIDEPRRNVPPSATIVPDEVRPTDDETTQPSGNSSSPTARQAVIAIGLYGQQRNVDKMVRRLEAIGYTPFTRREGRLTRVGASLNFSEDEQLFEALNDLRSRYTQDAFVYRLDGELQPLQ